MAKHEKGKHSPSQTPFEWKGKQNSFIRYVEIEDLDEFAEQQRVDLSAPHASSAAEDAQSQTSVSSQSDSATSIAEGTSASATKVPSSQGTNANKPKHGLPCANEDSKTITTTSGSTVAGSSTLSASTSSASTSQASASVAAKDADKKDGEKAGVSSAEKPKGTEEAQGTTKDPKDPKDPKSASQDEQATDEPKKAKRFWKGKKSKKDSEEPEVVGGNLAAASASDPSTKPDAAVPATPTAPVISIKPERDYKRIAKRAGIVFSVIVVILALVYFAGVFAFSTVLMPNSKVSDLDMSFKTKDQVSAELDDVIGKYNFKVKGHGMNVVITSAQAGIALDADAVAAKIIDSQDPWQWPLLILQEHDVSPAVAEAMSATGLSEVIKAEVERVNATGIAPIDATVAFVEESNIFEVIPEVGGTLLDFERVLEKAVAGTLSLDGNIILTKDVLVQPQVFEDDRRLAQAALEANRYTKANVNLALDGTPIGVVDASIIWPWVEISPTFEVVFNNDKMNEWAKDVATKCNTVGSTRTYTRPDGKVVTVSGGTYGWKIDSDALVQAIDEAVKNGTVGTIDIPVTQAGSGFTTLGGQDWGNRYVDVDLPQQYARFYDDSGNIIWESPIVSGLPRSGRATPRGVFSLNSKSSPATLVGYNPDGSKDYESKVQYWMPFKGNAVGLHDASWQSSFGGNRYTYAGSHGCVNLPTGKARELYGIIRVGDVVVVHS